LKFACSAASLAGTVKASIAPVLVDAPLHWLKVQLAPAVVEIVRLTPSANRPAGQSKVVAGMGELTVPQPFAVRVSARHALMSALSVTDVPGMVNVSVLVAPL